MHERRHGALLNCSGVQIWHDHGGEQDAAEVKVMVQKLVALGDNDGVPASGEQLQATVDAMIAKIDDSGDGKVLRFLRVGV